MFIFQFSTYEGRKMDTSVAMYETFFNINTEDYMLLEIKRELEDIISK